MTKDSTSVGEASGQSAAGSPSAEAIGSFLKRHRQSQGKDLEEVADQTHISVSILQAIEEDNFKALPAEVFTRGFVRNYAQHLGLDPSEALAWYIAQHGGEERPTEKINVKEVLAGEAMAEIRTFPLGRFSVFFLVVAVLFLVGYLFFGFPNSSVLPFNIFTKDATPVAVVGPPVPVAPVTGGSKAESGAEKFGREQAEPLAQDPSPLSGATPEKTGQEEKNSLSVPEKEGEGGEASKVGGEQSQAVKKKTEALPPVIVPQSFLEKQTQNPLSQDSGNSAAVLSLPASSAEKSPEMNYVLEAKFTEETWLSVQRDTEKAKSATYHPGDYAVWQAEKNISLFVGNAGGLVLTLNGTLVSPFGKSRESARLSFPVQ